jgi:hypothetical protein
MKDIILIVLCFLPIVLLLGGAEHSKNRKQAGVIVVAAWVVWAAVGVSLGLTGLLAYTSYKAAKKARQQNKQKPSQFEGALADEGVSISRIGGSPHIYGNLTEVWDKSQAEIRKKSGGKK